jgi:hypothetical protein
MALAFLLVVALKWSLAYQNSEVLDDNYNLSWTATDDAISFRVSVKTTGWVGLGFSANNKGDMMGRNS